MKKYGRSVAIYFIIFAVIIAVLSVTNRNFTSQMAAVEFTYSDLMEDLEQDKVSRLEVAPSTDVINFGTARAYMRDGTQGSVYVPNLDSFVQKATDYAMEHDMELVTTSIPKTSVLSTILPSVILMVVAIFLFSFFFQRMQGGGAKMNSFGKSKAKMVQSDKNRVTFADVAGCDEEKTELQELVDFLKQPAKYVACGARIPKGVLLVGPPGTGKTLLAKSVAGEAAVPFFSISGSDFVEMFVGVGASRVRDLFEQAKKNAPCIVFIDEIDAVGRRRGAGLGGGHDEREQTLNQLLVEMDGFGVNEGVIVLAATNRADILDPAILRPGRFDRQVYVGKPDVKGREAILRVHAKNKPLSPDVDLKVVAQTTAGFSGADLENLLNEAALLTVRHNKTMIDMAEIQNALVKVGIGTEKKSRIISDREKAITAYHEAGHAILFEKLPLLDPVHSISIIPTGPAGGYTMPLPGEDQMYRTKRWMEEEIISFFGGRAAEAIIFGDVTTGASNDIEQATGIARNMVMSYGMSDKLGPVKFGSRDDEIFIGKELAHSRDYGEGVANAIDGEVHRILETAYEEAIRLLKENMPVLHAAAKLLIEKEKVTGDEFRQLFESVGGDAAPAEPAPAQ